MYEATFQEIIRHFAIDRNTSQSATLCCLHRNASNRFLHGICVPIAHVFAQQPLGSGQIQIHASFFAARRKSKRGRGAYGKMIVFGLMKCQAKGYTLRSRLREIHAASDHARQNGKWNVRA